MSITNEEVERLRNLHIKSLKRTDPTTRDIMSRDITKCFDELSRYFQDKTISQSDKLSVIAQVERRTQKLIDIMEEL